MSTEHLNGRTTVTVDEKSTMTSVTQFFIKHKTLIGVTALGVAFLLANRAMLRKELKNINFSAEFWPEDFVDPEFRDFME